MCRTSFWTTFVRPTPPIWTQLISSVLGNTCLADRPTPSSRATCRQCLANTSGLFLDYLPPPQIIFDSCHSGTAAGNYCIHVPKIALTHPAIDLEHCHSDHYSGPASTFGDVVVRRAKGSVNHSIYPMFPFLSITLVPLLVADPRSPFSAVTPGGLQFPTLGSPAMVVSTLLVVIIMYVFDNATYRSLGQLVETLRRRIAIAKKEGCSSRLKYSRANLFKC